MNGEPLGEGIGEIKEREHKAAKRLYVVVHANNLPRSDTAATELRDNLLTRFAMKEDDVMWFMPMTFSRQTIKEDRLAKQANPNVADWESLYKTFRARAPKRVMLSHEIVGGSYLRYPDKLKVDDMVDRTRDKGYVIGENTEVVVGGEAAELCVKNGAVALFESDHITKVMIDIGASKPRVPGDDPAPRILRDINENRIWGLQAKFDPERKMVEVTRRSK